MGRDLSLLHNLQTGSGSHQTLSSGYRGVSMRVKRPGREANHSPLSRALVKNGEAIRQLPHMFPRHDALLIKPRDIFTFFFNWNEILSLEISLSRNLKGRYLQFSLIDTETALRIDSTNMDV
jgi:hypothetical protein